MEVFAGILEFCDNNLFEISIALLVLFLVYIFLVVQLHKLVGNLTRTAFHSNICSEQSGLLSTLLHPLKVDQLDTDRLLDVLDISGLNCPFEHLPAGCQLTCWEPNSYGRPFLEKKAEESERVFLKEVLEGPIGDLDKIEEGSFDTVVSHMSLCSVPDPEEVLAEIHRLLRPLHKLVGNLTRTAFHSNICSEQSGLLSTLLHPLKVDQLDTDRLLDVLDISGLNCPFEHLPAGCQLTCWEPNSYGRPFLEKKAEESERVFLKEVLEGPIGDLDKIEEGSFDTVVSHMSLCSVPDPEEVLAEIHRLLRPGGSFYFLEHVADRAWFVRFLQTLSLPLLFVLGGKCRPNRQIWHHIDESEFTTHSYERFRVGAFSVRCPVIVGTATKSA